MKSNSDIYDVISKLRIDVLNALDADTNVDPIFQSILTDLRNDITEEQLSSCIRCDLHHDRTCVVPGEGSRSADIMMVGEGPGAEEDEHGRPFIGRAGEMLNKIIEAATWDRESLYITNLIKCRPPGNRAPKIGEVAQCYPYLQSEITNINPRVIICLGSIAAKALIHPDFKITEEHGKWFTDKEGRRIMAIYHPAYVLRQEGLGLTETKKTVWDAIQQVKDVLEK